MEQLRSRLRDSEGATAVEYGIMVALIAVVIILAVWLLGNTLKSTFEQVEECIASPENETCPDAVVDGDGDGATD